jgi:glutaconyl-CoA/methylmalonyl-CoA decarboxylase subunit gamma
MRRYDLDIRGRRFSVSVVSFSLQQAELEVDGVRYTVDVKGVITEGEELRPIGRSTARPVPSAAAPSGAGASPAKKGAATPSAGSITAPIPGQILAILVKEGDAVEAGQALVKIEAMKMENAISAPRAGTVMVVVVNVGDAVTQGQELLVIG